MCIKYNVLQIIIIYIIIIIIALLKHVYSNFKVKSLAGFEQGCS